MIIFILQKSKAYKKASGRLNLLSKMRCYLNTEAARKIYEMVIVPILTYSTLINLKMTPTRQQKLKSIETRAKRIIGGGVDVTSIYGIMKKKACLLIKRCILNDTCENFKNYFVINKLR